MSQQLSFTVLTASGHQLKMLGTKTACKEKYNSICLVLGGKDHKILNNFPSVDVFPKEKPLEILI